MIHLKNNTFQRSIMKLYFMALLLILCDQSTFCMQRTLQKVQNILHQQKLRHYSNKYRNLKDSNRESKHKKEKSEEIFRKNLTRLLKVPLLAHRQNQPCYTSYIETMNTLSGIAAHDVVKEAISSHLAEYSDKEENALIEPYATHLYTLNNIRFIMSDRDDVSRMITDIGHALGVPIHVIDCYEVQGSTYTQWNYHEFFQKHNSALIRAMINAKSCSLIIVVHQRDSEWPSRHLEKMIRMYAHAAGFLAEDLQKTLIVQTAPQSLKTEEEKCKDAKSPLEFFLGNGALSALKK